ncbi:hypothetical protein BCR37DRAFT_389457 [Protomyces lactucae-debilis]|uniref:Secreted protein n=1 Tax=Protomyces lactucae-debilis TaxID=2754530 RepID=A0A1Y2EXP9_PROLT|nr:uncharacterized protein BCR37DRAFT_389457 [Protomyces lactucae-debilis]ORY76373.1 hypothetical protein BCR37DRAFT_389457 [Protomyces lactucae-debilis]
MKRFIYLALALRLLWTLVIGADTIAAGPPVLSTSIVKRSDFFKDAYKNAFMQHCTMSWLVVKDPAPTDPKACPYSQKKRQAVAGSNFLPQELYPNAPKVLHLNDIKGHGGYKICYLVPKTQNCPSGGAWGKDWFKVQYNGAMYGVACSKDRAHTPHRAPHTAKVQVAWRNYHQIWFKQPPVCRRVLIVFK